MINKGEIVYCNMTVTYDKNKRSYKKQLDKIIFSRGYDDNDYFNLNVIKNKRLINKIDKKNMYILSNIKIVDLNIIARTGYIAKFK